MSARGLATGGYVGRGDPNTSPSYRGPEFVDSAPLASKEHSMQALNLALVIADGACRSDIECYAYWIGRAHQPDCYDLTKSNDDDHPKAIPSDKAKDVVMAQNAARYIDLRGDALPFRMVRDPSNPQLVHFEEKQR